MSIFRAFTLAAAVIGGGASLARNKLDREIQKKVDAKIEEAEAAAIAELEDEVTRVVGQQFLAFARNLLFKAGLIALIIGGRYADLYDHASMAIIIYVCLALFLVRDIWVLIPQAQLVYAHARKADWNLFRALREMIATTVFDRAYSKVMEETQDKKVKYWIALSRHTPESISSHIAESISQVAGHASVRIVRARAALALFKAGAMLVAYSLTLAWALRYTP